MTVTTVPQPVQKPSNRRISPQSLLPWLVVVLLLALWYIASLRGLLPRAIFPPPREVWDRLIIEAKTGRLLRDIIASLWRVGVAFGLAAITGIPLGMFLGLNRILRTSLLPLVNFLRSLSPLAWIPFAIFWFGVGDLPTMFLIYMATVFPLALATMAATANIPVIYFRVARDHGLTGFALLRDVILPAVLPQVITALRVGAGLSWLVVVAAEMIAGRDGLGSMVWDARNGVANDLLVAAMLVIGVIGMLLDRLIALLMKLPSVRWGYDA